MAIIQCKIRNKSEYAQVIVDDDDFDKLSKFKWRFDSFGYPMTNIKKDGIWKCGIRMHKIIHSAEGIVDHINRNKLDNRKLNLRTVTHAENMKNKGIYRNNKSGHKGVHWRIRDKVWIAQYRINNKQTHIGSFKTKDEAIDAFNNYIKGVTL